MARWLWDGVFSIDVPDTWEVRDSEDLIEILPPEPVGAVHLSSFVATDPTPPQPGQAAQWARDFAQRHAESFAEPIETATPFGRLAQVSLIEESGKARRHWEVGVRIWTEGSVLFTYNHDGSRDELVETARRIFASLIPDRPTDLTLGGHS